MLEKIDTTIPKTLFSIWFGSTLPEENKQKIIAALAHNPDYKYCIYSDKSTMKESDWQLTQLFCKEHKIRLIDLPDYIDSLINKHMVVFELNTSKSKLTEAGKKIHYARASDNLRLGLLYQNGGVYFEMDLLAEKGFGTLNAPQETLLARNNSITESVPDIPFKNRYYTLVQYYFIASLPGSQLIYTAIKATEGMYQQFNQQRNPFWMADLSRGLAESYTTATSGFGLIIALNHRLQHDASLSEQDFFLENANDYFAPHYSQSWLDDNDVHMTDGEEGKGAQLFYQAVNNLNEEFDIRRPTHLTKY